MGIPLVIKAEKIGPALPAVLQLCQAHFSGQCLHAFVKLGIPDIIGDGKLAVADIARELPEEVNQDALGRVLRVLTLTCVLEESAGPGGECRYNLTPAGALLQTKAKQISVASGVLWWLEETVWGSWALLPAYVEGSITTPPFDKYAGVPFVPDFLDMHPELQRHVDDFGSLFSNPELSSVTAAGFWEELAEKTVVAMGDCNGALLGAVATKFPRVRCVSFDKPRAIDKAGEPPEGVTFVQGDVFDASTIPRGDVIVMMKVLHCSDDSDAERILKNCHQVLPKEGRVYIAEAVMPEAGNMSPSSKPVISLDILMMLRGGKERTLRQWEALAEAAGFRVKEVCPGPPTCSLLSLEKLKH